MSGDGSNFMYTELNMHMKKGANAGDVAMRVKKAEYIEDY